MGEARTALLLHPDCGRHDPGWGHPEHQGRLPAIVSALEKATPELLTRVRQVEAQPAAAEDLLACHSAEMIARVRAAVAQADAAGATVALSEDTAVSGASWDAALAAVGCVFEGVDLALRGEVRSAFALSRPPGHHATADRSMGFCLFNAVALGARRAQSRGARRVLIVDWDVHHGNGTQDIFWRDADVFYLSLHQWPWYPGTGAATETGAGPGAGTTANVPLPRGTTAGAYVAEFRAAVQAAARANEPELILVSAGFDTLAGDPLGGFLLEPGTMHELAGIVLESARDAAPVVLTLEGGYDPRRTAAGVVEVFRALAGLPSAEAG